MRGSKSTWVLCAGRKLVGFNVWIEIDLDFVRVIENDLFLCTGQKSLGSNVSTELDFVLVWVVGIDLTSLWGIELDLISA